VNQIENPMRHRFQFRDSEENLSTSYGAGHYTVFRTEAGQPFLSVTVGSHQIAERVRVQQVYQRGKGSSKTPRASTGRRAAPIAASISSKASALGRGIRRRRLRIAAGERVSLSLKGSEGCPLRPAQRFYFALSQFLPPTGQIVWDLNRHLCSFVNIVAILAIAAPTGLK
jgi:hypothetical protein